VPRVRNPGEAELLINLIETLLKEWYINREERMKSMKAVIQASAGKKKTSGKTTKVST